jgi:hypothetical protein
MLVCREKLGQSGGPVEVTLLPSILEEVGRRLLRAIGGGEGGRKLRVNQAAASTAPAHRELTGAGARVTVVAITSWDLTQAGLDASRAGDSLQIQDPSAS